MTVDELRSALAGSDAAAQLEKLGFSTEFVAANVFSAGGPVTVAQIAMLWQGMPNKHDRKRTRQMFDALASAGLVEATDDTGETWKPT